MNKTRCMICDKLTDIPVESPRPQSRSSILAVMICEECRGEPERLFWKNLGDMRKRKTNDQRSQIQSRL